MGGGDPAAVAAGLAQRKLTKRLPEFDFLATLGEQFVPRKPMERLEGS